MELRAKCKGCLKTPEELSEYWPENTGEDGLCAEEYVWQNEGTLNKTNGHFYCTPCYIAADQPLGVAP